jgi:S-formylglutathione hydrolase FrmB
MSLTGVPLLVVLILLSIAAPALVARAWFDEGRVRRVLVVLLAQLAAVATTAALANDYGDFYPSWSDLFGSVPTSSATTRSFGAASGGGAPEVVAGGTVELSAAQADSIAAGLKPTDWSKRGEWATRGALVHLPSPAAGNRPPQDVLAYLPPSWFSGRPGATSMPLVELLTGYPGTPHTIVDQLHAPQILLDDLRKGTAHPMMLLITRPVEPFPRDTECTDVAGGPDTFTYLSEALPRAATEILRLRVTAMGAVGYSTGGYCSLKLAMLRSDRFTAGASMSGYYRALPGANSGDLFGGSSTERNHNDLDWRLAHLPPPRTSVLVATSKEERYDDGYEAAQRFLGLVKGPMSAQEIVLDRGGHNFKTWTAEFPRILPWLDARLRGAPTTTQP